MATRRYRLAVRTWAAKNATSASWCVTKRARASSSGHAVQQKTYWRNFAITTLSVTQCSHCRIYLQRAMFNLKLHSATYYPPSSEQLLNYWGQSHEVECQAWLGIANHVSLLSVQAEVAFFAAHVLTANLYRRVAIYGSAIIGNYE